MDETELVRHPQPGTWAQLLDELGKMGSCGGPDGCGALVNEMRWADHQAFHQRLARLDERGDN